ncbi:hypothetical protein CCAN11_2390012 [Capnocytophaga canimorsus]|uniref:Uncharacterized protein n=1 Tax=Capnocytophaga canimorsus TaxID=28188 RepID=A0A0B7IPW1_9FLAO|nr:hypothetical protein CCAN11_2390012 [Capnocytophaga canimorsus]
MATVLPRIISVILTPLYVYQLPKIRLRNLLRADGVPHF